MATIEDILDELDRWYQEPSSGGERPKLLSKFAVMELCGWIENEFDRLIREIDGVCLNDSAWVEREVIARTYGFNYGDHLRPMLARVVGEVLARRAEANMELQNPGDLDRLRGILSELWKQRCRFAHSDIPSNVAMQQTFNAPSWAKNQYRLIKKINERFRVVLLATLP